MIKSVRPDQRALSEGFNTAENCQSFGSQYDYGRQGASLSSGMEDSGRYGSFSCSSPNGLSSEEESTSSPEFSVLSSPQSPFLDLSHSADNSVEAVRKCSLLSEWEAIPDQSNSSHSGQTHQTEGTLSNENSIIPAGFLQSSVTSFTPLYRDSALPSLCEVSTKENKVSMLLNSSSVSLNAGIVRSSIPKIKKVEEGRFVQKSVSTILNQKLNSKRNLTPEFKSISCRDTNTSPQWTFSGNAVVLDVKELNRQFETVSRIKLPADTMVDGSDKAHDREHELVICSTPEYEFSKENDKSVADLSSMNAKPPSSNGATPYGLMGKNGVLRLFDINVRRNSEINASDSFTDIISKHMDEVELENGLTSLSEEIKISKRRTSLGTNLIHEVNGVQTAKCSSAPRFDSSPCGDDSKQLVELIKTQKSISSSLPIGQTPIQAGGLQVTECSHPTTKSTKLMDDSSEKLKNGIIEEDITCFSQQGITGQAVNCVSFNAKNPSTVEEDSTGSVSTKEPHQTNCSDKQSNLCSSNLLKGNEDGGGSVKGTTATSGAGTHLSPQTVSSNRKLINFTDSEQTVPRRLKENEEGEGSVSFTKQRHQLLEADENVVTSRLIGESQRDSKQFDESSAGAIKGENTNHATDVSKTGDDMARNDLATNKCKAPSTAEKSPVKISTGTHLSSPSVCPYRITDLKQRVKFIWSNKFVSPVKTASIRHQNIVRVVENVSEHSVNSMKGGDIANWSFQDKRPQQPESPELNRCLSSDRKRSHEKNSNQTVTERASTTIAPQTQTVKCIFPWRGYESTVSSKRPKICQITHAVEFDTPLGLKLVSRRRTPPCEISVDAPVEKNGCNQLDIASEAVVDDPFDSSVIPESLPESKCMLDFENPEEDDVEHLEHCEIVACALELRDKQSSMLRSLSSQSIAEDLVNHIIGNLCRQFLLDNVCSADHCDRDHDVHFNFDLPGHDLKTSFNVFSRWYFSNSKQPNFKVLLHLLSLLSRDFGDELLITILCYSPALLKVAPNFRRPLGIKLIEKLVHLVDFTKERAIRTIIIFNVTNSTEEPIITDLLNSLGVYEEEMCSLYESVSCIWHINRNYSFSKNVFFAMLNECLQEMPPHFGVTKDKMVVELLKYPRSVLTKQFHIIERILLKYYALNSFAAYKVRSVVKYGRTPVPDCSQKRSYSSSRVKSTGPINENWQYWDLNEERFKSMELVLCKMRQEGEDEEEVWSSHELPTAPGLEMDELLDGTDTGENLKLLTTLSNYSVNDTSKYVNRMQNALEHRDYKQLGHIIMGESVRKSLDTYLDELRSMLTRLKKSELPLVVYGFLKEVPLSLSNKTALWIRSKFAVLINSLVLAFYKRRDYKSALKLLKTLRMGGMNPLGLPPDGVDEQTFRVICSEIHFECRSVGEAVKILLSGKSLAHVRSNCTAIMSNYFYPLERLVVKILKYFSSTKRAPALAMSLFRAVLAAQNSLFFPIDISVFYEHVICSTFIKCKTSCPLYDGVNLYVTVQRSCRHEVIFRRTTYRSLVVELVRSKAPGDILRRTLQLCLHFKVYSAFTPSLITLGTHLLEEEMYIYLLHNFQYHLAQDEPAFSQRPCSVQLLQFPKPTRGQFQFLQDLKKVSTEISDAIKRFEEALRRIVGEVYPNLLINFRSPSEIFIPTVGMEVIATSLLKHIK